MAYDARREDLREHPQSTPAHKDRRRWCKGRAGKSHSIEVAVPPNIAGWDPGCSWQRWYVRGRQQQPTWRCAHVYRCTTCGKTLDRLPPAQCPARPKVAAR